jgi:L-amino acid N-acyltransferase YncA
VTTIRLATDGDFTAIAAITNHYIRTTAIHFGYEDVTADEVRATWREHHDVHPWLVCCDSDDVLGYAKSGAFRARAAYRWIVETGIYFAPAHTGRGLGAPLYQRLLAVLRAQGFHAAIGGIALPNAASVRLHERLGFVHAGTVPRAGRKFDRWHDLGFWHLALQEAAHAPHTLLTPAAAFAATT